MKKPNRIILIAAAILIACGFYFFIWGNDRAKIESLMTNAHIGPLPASATNLLYHQWNGLFTGETYAKFQLPPDDLQQFIQRISAQPHHYSDNLDKLETFDADHQLRPISELSKKDISSTDQSYFGGKFPDWFDMSIRKKGRRFVLDWGPNMWVVINEESHTVFLWVVKG